MIKLKNISEQKIIIKTKKGKRYEFQPGETLSLPNDLAKSILKSSKLFVRGD